MNIKSYILNKLIFPKAVTISQPGLILTKVIRKENSSLLIGRLAYIFEDILVELQKETLKKIGEKKTDEIWYKIGKDLVISYFLTLNAKKPPKFFLDSVLKYIFQRFFATGITIGSEIKFDKDRLSLYLKGKNSVLHRKSKQGAVLGGIVSGTISFLSGQNIAAETRTYEKDEGVYCEIKCNKKILKKYIPDFIELRDCVQNYKFDFVDAERRLRLYETDFSSMNKFLRFRKAKIKDNIIYFYDRALMAGEINIADHIMRSYIEEGLGGLIEKILIESSEEILKEIFDKIGLSKKDKLKFIQNMMAGFGWGIPLYKKQKNKIIFSFVYGVQAKTNSFLFYVLQLQGFLNCIFEKKVKLVDAEEIKGKTTISRAVYKI